MGTAKEEKKEKRERKRIVPKIEYLWYSPLLVQ
jgi:hypothetical protein